MTEKLRLHFLGWDQIAQYPKIAQNIVNVSLIKHEQRGHGQKQGYSTNSAG